MAVAVDEKAFLPGCVQRSKLDATDATAVVCLLGLMRIGPTAAAALQHAVLQHQHAVQLQHQHAVQLQHQHAVQLQHQHVVQLQLRPVVVQLQHVVVAHDPVVVQHLQHQAADVALLLQSRQDAALAEQRWMLAQSAPGTQHQPFHQHPLLQQRLVAKLQLHKLFELLAIPSSKSGLRKHLDNRAAISIEIQLGFFVCIDLVSSNSN